MTTYFAKTGDDGSFVDETLLDGDGNAVDLAGASIRFLVRASVAAQLKIDGTADNQQNGDGSDGSKGMVRYTYVTGDLDTAGFFLAEWEVTYGGGGIETFPQSGYILLRVGQDLDL